MVPCDVHEAGVEHDPNADVPEGAGEALGDIVIHHRHQMRPAVDQRHRAGERSEDRCVFAADRATPDDHEVAHGLVEIQNGRGVDHVGIVEVDPGRVKRA